ncbi:sugar transporter [Dentiradicibacter hellwigii]|uniref:Sugar transporter n=1 Tax=Dentiradicibacter hellwigii TaxID=3149053 RepID=A0ABV4UFU4_9RHOO
MPLVPHSPMPPRHAAYRLAWLRVLTLAVAAFVFNTTEFIPIALLSDIGAGFGMSAAQTGVMLTVYAWVVALASLPGMLLEAQQERRSLLLALFALFIASHALSALAWNFTVLLISRIGVALAHAVFWAITAALVVRLAPPGRQQQAIGWLSMGTALATVLGLPLGRFIGQLFGWRTTFALIAVAAAAVMLAVFLLLPRLPSRNAGSVASLPLLARRPLLLGLYAFTALIIAAHFTAYSYIEPFARQFSGLGESATTALLLVFGLSGMVASVLFARLHARMPTRFLTCAVMLLCSALLLLRPLGASPPALFALVFCWGIGIAALSLALMVRVLRLAPDATDVAIAIYSGIYNIGIGGGALIGRLVMQHGELALIGLGGAVLALVGSALFAWTQWRFRMTR